MLIRDIIESIKNTAGSNAKRAILEANKSELLDMIFADTYDKSRNYFIKKYDKNWGENYLYGNVLTIDEHYSVFHDMLEVLNSDYIRTARAKGLKESVVINKHAFRNTLIPLVTSLAGLLPSLFSGAIITEQVFDLPGIGNVAFKAMMQADIPFIMGYNMFLALLSVMGVLLADLMYVIVDPRVKLTK